MRNMRVYRTGRRPADAIQAIDCEAGAQERRRAYRFGWRYAGEDDVRGVDGYSLAEGRARSVCIKTGRSVQVVGPGGELLATVDPHPTKTIHVTMTAGGLRYA
jgi:hypothetical protein